MIGTWHNLCMRRRAVLVCLTSCGLLRRNGARTPARASASRTPPFGRQGIPREMADSRVLATARRIHIRRRVAVLRDSSHFRGFRPAGGGEASRAWHPREFGAVLGGSASLALASASGWSAHRADHRQAAATPLHAPPLPSSSRRYAPQCFVGEYTFSPCDVSHRASDEPRRRMSLSSALAPSSLASPSHRRVCLRSICGGAANPPRRLRFRAHRFSRQIRPRRNLPSFNE